MNVPLRQVKEVYMICEKCGATATLERIGKDFIPTKNFIKVVDKIYHSPDKGVCKAK